MTDRYELSQGPYGSIPSDIRCPEGHPMQAEWGDYGHGPGYINALCGICRKAWRLQKRTDGTWDWQIVMVPNPEGDKPIDLPPLTSDGE